MWSFKWCGCENGRINLFIVSLASLIQPYKNRNRTFFHSTHCSIRVSFSNAFPLCNQLTIIDWGRCVYGKQNMQLFKSFWAFLYSFIFDAQNAFLFFVVRFVVVCVGEWIWPISKCMHNERTQTAAMRVCNVWFVWYRNRWVGVRSNWIVYVQIEQMNKPQPKHEEIQISTPNPVPMKYLWVSKYLTFRWDDMEMKWSALKWQKRLINVGICRRLETSNLL